MGLVRNRSSDGAHVRVLYVFAFSSAPGCMNQQRGRYGISINLVCVYVVRTSHFSKYAKIDRNEINSHFCPLDGAKYTQFKLVRAASCQQWYDSEHLINC